MPSESSSLLPPGSPPPSVGIGSGGLAGGIGFVGSLAIAVNNLTGPGMLDLPATFQKSGLVPSSLCILAISLLSSLTSLALSSSIARMPGNASFSQPVEYSAAASHYLGRSSFAFTQVLFALCVLSQAVASIISTSQVVDAFVATSLGETYALSFPGLEAVSWAGGDCDDGGAECLPFSPSSYSPFILTLGYAITTFALLPLCLMDLKENVAAQLLSFGLLLLFLAEFVWSFSSSGFHAANINLWGTEWKELLGVVLFASDRLS